MHTPIKLTLYLLLFACSRVLAHNDLPPIYEIKTDTASVYNLPNSFTQLLEDPEGQLTIHQVSNPSFTNQFGVNQTKEQGINYNIHTYWVRFRIKNYLPKVVTMYVQNQIGSFGKSLDYFYLYIPEKNGDWVEKKTGVLVPWSQRAGAKYLQAVPVHLRPNQQITIYVRLHSSFRNINTPDYLDIRFIPEPPIFQKAYTNFFEGSGFRNNFLGAVFFGVFLTAILFTLYNYVLIKERAYFYYLFFLFFYLLVQSNEYFFLFYPEYPGFFYWGDRIFWVLVHFFLVQFIREYLNTRKLVPFWDRLLLSGIALQVLYWIFWFTSPILSFRYLLLLHCGITFTYDIVIFLIAITLIKLYRQNYRPAKFLLVILSPFLVFWSVVEFVFLMIIVIQILWNSKIELLYWPEGFFSLVDVFTILWIVVFFSGALTRRYTQARKALADQALEKERLEKEKEIDRRQLIEAQKIELEKQVSARTAELKQSLEYLKATQTQLIQTEKMASLGELTAGIAHEIQNPLNFVNNFSDVNTELLTEIDEEIDKGNIKEVKSLVNNIKDNEQKIKQHGQRADAIVKNMLQHSRTSSGQKQLTDINALAEEYLRLSYHGFRVKDKVFNINLITDFDNTLGKLEVVPQELGRVLLNLYNNAFYATLQKKAQLNGQFQPKVKVSTYQKDGKLEIKVWDNGTGIPDTIKHKIFQPFFTTKSTGQGTGLGLSLSYDIIKSLGGELKVDTQVGEFTEFTVQLTL